MGFFEGGILENTDRYAANKALVEGREEARISAPAVIYAGDDCCHEINVMAPWSRHCDLLEDSKSEGLNTSFFLRRIHHARCKCTRVLWDGSVSREKCHGI